MPSQTPTRQTRTWRLRVTGIVQGVGFRPTVSRHARAAGVTGTVCNKGPYVEIVCQGTPEALTRFCTLVEREPPRRATIISCSTEEVETSQTFGAFRIVESERTDGAIFVSPDIGICEDCAAELFDPSNRRYLHPFINCTNCGPRLTILDALPYDRERTSMAAFPMCERCAREYHDRHDRRFDAQPVCCNDCGPTVSMLDRPETGPAAITCARRIVAAGGIVAVKGIGGFHLCCDATSEDAVRLLRARKRRPAKPFAVMARDMAVVERECVVGPCERDLVGSHQKPIVLMDRKASGLGAASLAPDNPRLGVMLPYTPLHLLLFDYPDDVAMPDLLVMTSANESGAPICRDDADVRRELVGLTDAVLTHDRLIRVRADDTVTDTFRGHPYMVRRSRGYAPLPQPVSGMGDHTILAVGGELKCTFCIATDGLCYLSPYVGDLTDVRTVEALSETARRMCELLEVTPDVVVCDAHPAYNSRTVAASIAPEAIHLEVQHHVAHVASCLAERGHQGRAIGVALDGTGYGDDGTIWGGELFVVDGAAHARRGHITPFAQVGGDASSREGWRVACSLLADVLEDDEAVLEAADALGLCGRDEARITLAMRRRGLNTVRSTSAGRVFDAVAALLGLRLSSTFEGEAACALQFSAERHLAERQDDALDDILDGVPLALGTDAQPGCEASDTPFVLATTALFARLFERRRQGVSAGRLAAAFHKGLADQIVAACRQLSDETGIRTCALTGGCFQNLLLTRLVVEGLEQAGLVALTHSLVPPNDGGIALGQAVVASAMLADDARTPEAGPGPTLEGREEAPPTGQSEIRHANDRGWHRQ